MSGKGRWQKGKSAAASSYPQGNWTQKQANAWAASGRPQQQQAQFTCTCFKCVKVGHRAANCKSTSVVEMGYQPENFANQTLADGGASMAPSMPSSAIALERQLRLQRACVGDRIWYTANARNFAYQWCEIMFNTSTL